MPSVLVAAPVEGPRAWLSVAAASALLVAGAQPPAACLFRRCEMPSGIPGSVNLVP
ncbi:MAG TPA: hypothetical protein VE621_13235 [Bryobacteraceae bacterium]|jgi:hypothetical protein|nr:hypothetical protein [Bryobacteraceae bacterium]